MTAIEWFTFNLYKKCNSAMGVYFGEDVYVKGYTHRVPNTRSINYIQINEKRNRSLFLMFLHK